MGATASPLSATDLARLRDAVSGRVSIQGDPDYETGRRVWNAAVDRRPSAIVHCSTAADAARALSTATE